MEVVEVPGQPGKLDVLFNNQSIPCVDDIECPGAGICAVNQTWSVHGGGVCMCNTKYGFQGLDCKEWCTEAWMTLVLNTLAVVIGFVLAIIATWLFVRVMCGGPCCEIPFGRQNCNEAKPVSVGPTVRRAKWNPISLTLFLAATGQWLFFAAAIVDNVATLTFPYMAVVSVNSNDRQVTRTPQSVQYLNVCFWAFAYCITICCVVVLPFAWIDIAEQSRMMKKGQSRLVMIASVLFVFIIISIELPFYILAVQQYQRRIYQWSLAAMIAWAVIFSFIIGLNVFVFFRVRKIRSRWLQDDDQEQTSTSLAQVQKMMYRIQVASAQIAVVSVVAFILMAFGHVRDQRTLYSDPHCYFDVPDFLYNLSMPFVQYLCAVALWFVYPSARILGRMNTPRPSTTSGGPTLFKTKKSSSRPPATTQPQAEPVRKHSMGTVIPSRAEDEVEDLKEENLSTYEEQVAVV